MFRQNDYVCYGLRGICRVADLVPCPFDEKDTRTFYVLKPINVFLESTYYVPANNDAIPLRAVMTREEAQIFLDSVGQIGEITFFSDKQRRDACRAALMENRPESFVSVIKTLTCRRIHMQQHGRQLSNRESELEHAARTHLTNEISVSFGIEVDEAGKMLRCALGEQE